MIEIKIKKTEKDEVQVPYDELTEGIWCSTSHKDTNARIIVTEDQKFFVLGRVFSLADDSWKKYKFIKVDEEITVTFS